MSIFDDLDIKKFLETLSKKTMDSEIVWKKVPRGYYNNLIDRAQTDGHIRDCYFSDSKVGRIVVGKFRKKVYYEEDQYYNEDEFFITFTNFNYEDPTSILESDDDVSLNTPFSLLASKLHRLIQINTNDIKNKIENWFD